MIEGVLIVRTAFRDRTFRAGLCALFLMALAASPAWAGPYSRLQVLLPGETAAPGTPSGKTGSPRSQTAGVPFTVAVRACDDQWNTAGVVTDAIQILASDASASLPPVSQLSGGTGSWSVTLNAGGSFRFFAHDQTDNTIPDGVSSLTTSLVLQGFEFSRITQKNQSAGAPMTITVTARDPNGSIVTGYSGDVSIKEITSFGDGRTSPVSVTLASGSWTGPVTMYRADETSINRGNVNLYAWLANAPAKNGTSDPFTVHPGGLARLQIVAPGQTPAPGTVSGLIGSPASQAASRAFTAGVYATDTWWNPVVSGDQVRITSSDPAAGLPAAAALTNGFRAFSVSLGTVGTQTLTASDLTSGSVQSMTSVGIAVIPSAADHFVIASIASPQVAGVPVAVTVRAVDAAGNTVPNFGGDANLSANTGAGSISPSLISFTNGVWTGPITFRGAGGAVTLACSDFSAPPHIGSSNSFTVQPGPFTGLQVLLPGETAQGGTPDGKSNAPTDQTAGTPFMLTVRAVDAYWNLVSGVTDRVKLGSTDAFAGMPADTTLANGQLLMPVRLFRTGLQRIWAADSDNVAIRPDTSSQVRVIGGSFSRVLILAPGESPAPGTATGRTGTATDQSINYAFTVTVLATDSWWNPVGGATDLVHVSSGDPLASLPPDAALVDGRADMIVRLSTGGFQQISVNDVTQPSKTGSTTQVRAITSGFHLEATVAPATARAGEPFTLTVRVTNDAGSVIQEVNSFVTIEIQNANDRSAGRGTLLTTQFQLLQGQRAVSETYTFAEPIVLVARDDAGNAPGITNPITILPGVPAAIRFTSNPAWVGGNRHATLSARLVDAYENGIPAQPMTFQQMSGTGTLTAIDSLTDSSGTARADFLSPRQPERDLLRSASNGLTADLDLETAFVDPTAAGGTATNYPNPFHPPAEPTVIAWKLDDHAAVTLRIFSQTGILVRREQFERASPGGSAGLNEWRWDGRNGDGAVVASGGYVLLIEAQGQGETLHVIRRKIAVVR
jgi:FlgD Ig-like domain